MKILIALFAFFALCCKYQSANVHPVVMDSIIYRDSVITIQDNSLPCDSLTAIIARFEKENDSLKTSLFIAQYKVSRVRYYLNICLRNPSQDKFLKGWIKRAIQ